jgi:tetratricopeptide (TPR) repeat protein
MRVALVVSLLLAVGGSVAGAAVSRPAELPPPSLVITVAPLAMGVERPPLDPPPPPPIQAPPLDLGSAPAPRFVSAVGKPFPAVPDPGGFACVFVALGRAETLARCGLHRLASGDYQQARGAFEESIAIEPGGAQAPAAYVWLGELALVDPSPSAAARAERWYRAALPLAPPPELAVHAQVGLGLLALRRGAPAEAEALLDRALRAMPAQPIALVARYLLGVAQLLLDRPEQALARWNEVEHSGASGALLTELPFWRGVAHARLRDAERGEDLLLRFVEGVPPGHPLRGDALVQAAWIAMERGATEEAVRRFLRADAASPRPELRPQLRAGLVRAYLALGDTVRAHSVARQLRAEAPRDPLAAAALLLIADADRGRGAVAEAAEVYREALLLPMATPVQDYVRYRLGEALEQQGRLSEAKAQYRELRDRGRDEGIAQRASYRLGLLGLREKDAGAARREGETLLRAGVVPELHEGALLLVGESAARGGDPNRAVAVFRLALRDHGHSPHAARTRLALGWALLGDRDVEGAIREWRQVAAAAEPQTRAQALLAIADHSLRHGREADAAEALRLLGGASAEGPRADAVLLNRGILLLRTHAYGDALQALEPIASRVADFPTQALVARALGIAHYQLGRYEQAERQFRRSAQVAPQEPSSWLGAGLAALAQNRLAEADDALGRARYASVDVATAAWYGLVLVAVQRGDQEQFRTRATDFVDRFPRHPAAPAVLYAMLARAIERGDLAHAQGVSQRLLREHPSSEYGTHALLSLAAAAPARPEIARPVYRDLLQRPATPPEARASAWLGLAEIALAGREAAEAQRAAEGFLREIPADDPRTVRAHLILARAHELLGQRDQALAAIDALVDRFPANPEVPALQITRGQLLLDLGFPDRAQSAFDAASRTEDPAVAAAAHFWLGEALRARGDAEAATSAYLTATYVYPDSPWAARGLQGAALAYVARQMPREATIVLRRLAARPGVDPALLRWARESLARLGAAGAEPSARLPGAPPPPARP